nr:ribonuclease H-like domain-containing protein [Tanacetum cinerariifolium]
MVVGSPWKKYALDLLDRAHMANCNPFRTPFESESKLSSEGAHVSNPALYLSLAGGLQSTLKRVLRYVHGTLDFRLQLFVSSNGTLVAYSYAERL